MWCLAVSQVKPHQAFISKISHLGPMGTIIQSTAKTFILGTVFRIWEWEVCLFVLTSFLGIYIISFTFLAVLRSLDDLRRLAWTKASENQQHRLLKLAQMT